VLTTGIELGIGPATSLRAIHVIKGRATLSADLMAGLAMKAGVTFEYLQNDETGCRIKWTRGNSSGECVFTLEDAKRAGLLGNPNWKNYPTDMCAARAKSKAARQAAPDVLAGLYTPDEITHQAGADAPIMATVVESKPIPAEVKPAPEVKPKATTRTPAQKAITQQSMPGVSNAKKARLFALVNSLGLDGGKRIVDGVEVSTILVTKVNAEIVDAIACATYDTDDALTQYIVPRELNEMQVDGLIEYLESAQAGADIAETIGG
jgi:hypothetical protein